MVRLVTSLWLVLSFLLAACGGGDSNNPGPGPDEPGVVNPDPVNPDPVVPDPTQTEPSGLTYVQSIDDPQVAWITIGLEFECSFEGEPHNIKTELRSRVKDGAPSVYLSSVDLSTTLTSFSGFMLRSMMSPINLPRQQTFCYADPTASTLTFLLNSDQLGPVTVTCQPRR